MHGVGVLLGGWLKYQGWGGGGVPGMGCWNTWGWLEHLGRVGVPEEVCNIWLGEGWSTRGGLQYQGSGWSTREGFGVPGMARGG